MNSKEFWDTYILAGNINNYRDSQQKETAPDPDDEYCENYFRVDDEENDGRGSF